MALGDKLNPNRLASRIGVVDRAPVQRYPSWMDARYQLAAAAGTVSEIITLDAAGRAVVPGNPRRYALGFVYETGQLGNASVGPFTDVFLYPLAVMNATTPLWFTLADFGPFVAYEWYVGGFAGDRFRYFQCEVR